MNGKVKIAIGQGDDYKTSCLLDSSYFKDYYKMITIDLSKQNVLAADPRTIQRINVTSILNSKKMLFIIEAEK